MVDKFINFERLFGEAKSLVSRLRESDRSADLVVERAENIRSKIDTLKQYHSEAEMLQQFYPERPIRSSRRAVLREVALKNKRLAELSAENAELREMLVDQQSALDHIMIKYREQTFALMEMTRLNEQFLQQLDEQNIKEHQEAMEKIGDMAAVMAEAAALDEDRELRLVRAVHQLHLENSGLRELLVVSRRFGTGADPFERGHSTMSQAGDASPAHRSGTFLMRSGSGSQYRSRAVRSSTGSGSSMDSSLAASESTTPAAAAEQDVSATDHYASHFSTSTCIRRAKPAAGSLSPLEQQLAPSSEAPTSEALCTESERERPQFADKQTATDDLLPIDAQAPVQTPAPADASCPHCAKPLLSNWMCPSAFSNVQIGTSLGSSTPVQTLAQPHTPSNSPSRVSPTPELATLAASPNDELQPSSAPPAQTAAREDQTRSQPEKQQVGGASEQQVSVMEADEALAAPNVAKADADADAVPDAVPDADTGIGPESSSDETATTSPLSDLAASN